jgi:hypothetical protein
MVQVSLLDPASGCQRAYTKRVTHMTLPPIPPSASIFVGKNYEYYQVKWAALEIAKNRKSWNWAAFFFGPFWLAYRKIYVYAWGYVGLLAAAGVCQLAFHFDDNATTPGFLVVGLVIAIQGNYLYKVHVEKSVARIVARSDPQDAAVELAKRGGTSVGAAIGLLAGMVAVAVGLAIPLVLAPPVREKVIQRVAPLSRSLKVEQAVSPAHSPERAGACPAAADTVAGSLEICMRTRHCDACPGA